MSIQILISFSDSHAATLKFTVEVIITLTLQLSDFSLKFRWFGVGGLGCNWDLCLDLVDDWSLFGFFLFLGGLLGVCFCLLWEVVEDAHGPCLGTDKGGCSVSKKRLADIKHFNKLLRLCYIHSFILIVCFAHSCGSLSGNSADSWVKQIFVIGMTCFAFTWMRLWLNHQCKLEDDDQNSFLFKSE